MIFVAYMVLGAIAGMLAGLFGIGGGIIVVPVLVLAFNLQGINPEVVFYMAIATSLANIIFTSLSAIRTHHKKAAIEWYLVKPIAVGMLGGSFIGVNTALTIPAIYLQASFGAFAIFLSLRMMFSQLGAGTLRLPGTLGLGVTGAFIGWVSVLFGIGGGNLLVTWLSNRQLVIQKAVATASACGFAIAIAGAGSNAILGWGNPMLPPHSLGYIYLPALLGIVSTSFVAAAYGSMLAHQLSPQLLKRLFAWMLLLMGLRMLISAWF
ncbi:MAG: sulfite exporter TauE/SafE family protein [Pseudomonadales bacterium]|nr:sulfite exporter TauE/SafE family protein [Pseudomonadales bacterium]